MKRVRPITFQMSNHMHMMNQTIPVPIFVTSIPTQPEVTAPFAEVQFSVEQGHVQESQEEGPQKGQNTQSDDQSQSHREQTQILEDQVNSEIYFSPIELPESVCEAGFSLPLLGDNIFSVLEGIYYQEFLVLI